MVVQKKITKKDWSGMTPRAKRILLAKDVLAQIEAKRIVAKMRNGYIAISDEKDIDLKEGMEVKKILPKVQCTVCAKGALFLAHVDKFNTCKLTHYGDIDFTNELLDERMKGAFSVKTLDLIEVAFEGSKTFDRSGSITPEERRAAKAIAGSSRKGEVRLTRIMNHIIKHGDFKL